MQSESRTIYVTVGATGWQQTVTEVESFCERVITAALDAEPPPAGGDTEVSLLLADDFTVRGLNLEWRGKDQPTNVLSFPAGDQPRFGDAGPRLLGDIVVAYETVCREAAAEGKEPAAHLAHLLVHGTLHLLGHDHLEPAEAERMERREVEILAVLGVADPYRGELAA